MPQAYTEAKKKNNQKWDAENLWRTAAVFKIAEKEIIKAHAEAAGESVNAYIVNAVRQRIQGEPDPLKR